MKRVIFFTLVISVFLSANVHADKWRVNNDPNADADYLELQAANDDFNVSAGDTVYMEGSAIAYSGAEIDKKLIIIGPGYFLGANDSTQANKLPAKIETRINFNAGSAGSVVMGMYLDYYNTSILVNVNNMVIKRNRIDEIHINDGVSTCLVSQNYVENEILVKNNANATICNNISNEILVEQYGYALIYNNVFFSDNSGHTNTIHNSTFQNNIIVAADITDDGTNNNNIRNNLFGRAATATPENGNQYSIDMSAVFVDFDGSLGYSNDGKWKLKDGSPAYGSGYNGDDCGAFFGNTAYVLSGVPPFPHIFEVNMPASASQSSGLDVNVKIKSQN